jgi:beta-N-acetylhexosaminidase
VDEFTIPSVPADSDIAALVEALRGYDFIVLGTLNAFAQPAQAALVSRVLDLSIPTVVVAMRLPYDLIAFPRAQTYACTYSILEPSMQALSAALFGAAPFIGHLPVSIPGFYSIDHALEK